MTTLTKTKNLLSVRGPSIGKIAINAKILPSGKEYYQLEHVSGLYQWKILNIRVILMPDYIIYLMNFLILSDTKCIGKTAYTCIDCNQEVCNNCSNHCHKDHSLRFSRHNDACQCKHANPSERVKGSRNENHTKILKDGDQK